MTLITIEALRAAGATKAKAQTLLDPMRLAAALYSVDTPLRIAHFLAQVGHESGGFEFVREIWGPTPAQKRYEGRADLGNLQPGDGARYPGRGYGQTTGRANYAALRDRLRERLDNVPDFEADAAQLEQMPWAVLGAFDFWDMKHLGPLADADDFVTITHRWNGGENGIDDRRRRLQAIKAALAAAPATPEPAAFPDDNLIETAFAPPEKPMIPMLLPIALQALSALVPQLATIFGSGSEVSQRNVKAAEVVIEAAKTAAGAVNEQELVEKIQAGDPAVVQAVTEAVKTVYFEVVEAGGGGIAAARKANDATASQPPGSALTTPAFVLALLLLPLVYLTVWLVLTGDFPSEVKSMVITGVVTGIIGALTGFFFGSSLSSQRKDERRAV